MKTYQNLEIHIDSDETDTFLSALKQLISASKWSLRQDYVDNYKKNSFSKDKEVVCVESPEYTLGGSKIKGLLWIWDYNGYLEVFNIVPLIGHSLDYDQYNFLVNEFYNHFIKDLASKFNGNVVISAPIKKLVNTIGETALKALVAFSSGANKSTGNTHPFDFKRWSEFIFIIHRNRIELDADELIHWLEENGWDSERAHRLGSEFEYSLNLLENYERD